nr:hypothetical protein [Pseudomonas sp.]
MTAASINALLASAYNLHVGPKAGGEAMTPAKAAKLKRADRVALAFLLREKGGSDAFSKEDADRAYIALVG